MQLQREVIILDRLEDVVKRADRVPLQRILRQAGHKNQHDHAIHLPQISRRFHPGQRGHPNVHINDVVLRLIFLQEEQRVMPDANRKRNLVFRSVALNRLLQRASGRLFVLDDGNAHSHGIPSSLVTNILPCAEGKCKAGFIPLFLLLSLCPPWCASSSGGCFLCRMVLNNQSAVWFCFSGIGMRMDTMNQLFSCLMVICPSYFSTASRIPLIP